MTRPLHTLLSIAQAAVSHGRTLITNGSPGALTSKGDRDMATEMDLTIEREVRAFLQEATPEIPILAEEEGGAEGADGRCWVLDPIDGTANFVRGIPLCAISLGLIENRQPIAGVIDLPFLGLTYHAAEGEGAYVGDRKLSVTSTTALSDAVISIGDYAVGVNADSKNRLRLAVTQGLADRVQRVRMFGSAAVDLAWVAEGRLDASICLGGKPWDIAAGALIAREAGAVLLDKYGNEHTAFSTETIATTPALADDVIRLIQTARSPNGERDGSPN